MGDNTERDEFFLLRSMPTVLRAREFRLYTGSGRFVDLWQNGGGAALGHTPPSLLKEIKNTASRGLYAPFPHFLEGRFLKALSRLFPDRNFRLYSTPPQSLEQLMECGRATLWRPYRDPNSPFAVTNDAPVLVPVLPGISNWRHGLPQGLCVLAICSDAEISLPPGDILSPVLLAAAARGVYDLLANPDRGKPSLPRVSAVLKNIPLRREGIYLNPKATDIEWPQLFKHFLDAGFLIPPVPYQPLILPCGLSKGEDAKLANALKIFS
jgi:hypothetical protein